MTLLISAAGPSVCRSAKKFGMGVCSVLFLIVFEFPHRQLLGMKLILCHYIFSVVNSFFIYLISQYYHWIYQLYKHALVNQFTLKVMWSIIKLFFIVISIFCDFNGYFSSSSYRVLGNIIIRTQCVSFTFTHTTFKMLLIRGLFVCLL